MHMPPLFWAGAFFEMRGENDMGKLYTLDGKLLTETPELRIGEKVYPVDSRQKTVKKILALADDESVPMGERIDEALKLALGDKNAVEIDRMDMPFPAYQRLFELVMDAVTGQEDEPDKARFQAEKG
jgi:hypothetical protein